MINLGWCDNSGVYTQVSLDDVIELVPGLRALEKVLLRRVDEPTLVLFRGDHGGLARAEVLLDEVLQLLVPRERADVI